MGGALIALGYDRDFAELAGRRDAAIAARRSGAWQSVRLDGLRVQVPDGVLLDLGATAKGLGADWAAHAAPAASGPGGVLVSLGGDIAAAGDRRAAAGRSWSRTITTSRSPGRPTQVVRLTSGGLATSSITCRQWRRSGRRSHHIVDPRTGLPGGWPVAHCKRRRGDLRGRQRRLDSRDHQRRRRAGVAGRAGHPRSARRP